MNISPSYLMENGYLENVVISEFNDGTSFAIFEDWSDVYEVQYAVIEALVPNALELYEKCGLIKDSRWSNLKQLTDIRIDNEVPEIVREALDENNIKWYDIVESALGCEWGFSDEYTTCCDCGNVIRTSPDSYGWQPDYYVGDGFIACKECFDNTPNYQEAYIEERINNPQNAVNGLLDKDQIEELGFVEVDEDFENGWYNRHDNPQKIYDRLSENYEEVLFYVDGVGQFHVSFVAFVRGEYND